MPEITKSLKEWGDLLTPESGKGGNAMICAIWAANRQSLVDFINDTVVRFKEMVKAGEPFLSVLLAECGSLVEYQTEADIPEHSVPCPCGNPGHWLIKYEEEGK